MGGLVLAKTNEQVFPASDCLCAVYSRKHPVAPGSSPEAVIMIDVGQQQTTVVVASFGEGTAAAGEEGKGGEIKGPKDLSAGCPYSVLGVRSDEDLGAAHFSGKMFRHFREVVKEKYSHDVVPGTKQGLRLLMACRRLRELLSTTPTAETTVEVRYRFCEVFLAWARTVGNVFPRTVCF